MVGRLDAPPAQSAPFLAHRNIALIPTRAFRAFQAVSRSSAHAKPRKSRTIASLPRGLPRQLQQRLGQCRAISGNGAQEEYSSEPGSVSFILLAGGVGKRMGASIPKQYLELLGQPIAMYSLETVASMPEIGEVVIVCDPSYRALFQRYYDKLPVKPRLVFTEPGKERQDSVYNGFAASNPDSVLVAIHDSARPLVTINDVRRCLKDGLEVGAAVLGVPVKPTIKEVDSERNVVKTLARAALWEVQTPQVIRPALLREGFELVRKDSLEVTDDVSIIEALGRPVRVTQGSYTNIKVTTPDDMSVAERFLSENEAAIVERSRRQTVQLRAQEGDKTEVVDGKKPASEEPKPVSSTPKVEKGQTTAIVTGAISIIFGVLYLLLVQLLDSRGNQLLPPPPEAFGL
ncbi:hypothetical protein WJX75_005450 [Coccomyxa subellipsoidea]|uniref:2-C-methyl-D-erythritol 4-phosphate cytidylyltransferase n=1 Tax=Coccomyxa subellipsoidea TaxID=248742 RepID=A0ABR2YPP4_9CHLO